MLTILSRNQLEFFVTAACHRYIQIIPPVAESIVDSTCLKSDLFAPDNVFQEPSDGCCSYPPRNVPASSQRTYSAPVHISFFVPITKITEDPFLHIDRKLLIINTILRKVLYGSLCSCFRSARGVLHGKSAQFAYRILPSPIRNLASILFSSLDTRFLACSTRSILSSYGFSGRLHGTITGIRFDITDPTAQEKEDFTTSLSSS